MKILEPLAGLAGSLETEGTLQNILKPPLPELIVQLRWWDSPPHHVRALHVHLKLVQLAASRSAEVLRPSTDPQAPTPVPRHIEGGWTTGETEAHRPLTGTCVVHSSMIWDRDVKCEKEKTHQTHKAEQGRPPVPTPPCSDLRPCTFLDRPETTSRGASSPESVVVLFAASAGFAMDAKPPN